LRNAIKNPISDKKAPNSKKIRRKSHIIQGYKDLLNNREIFEKSGDLEEAEEKSFSFVKSGFS